MGSQPKIKSCTFIICRKGAAISVRRKCHIMQNIRHINSTPASLEQILMLEESGASTAQERTQALYNQFYFTFPVCKCILADIKAVNDLSA